MNINESAENYLETILVLSKRMDYVRSIDVATELNFKKSSVSVAMKHLRENGYLTVEDGGHLVLTPSGIEIANAVLERHTILSNLLIKLGVNQQTAEEDACKVEHILSKESYEAIKEYAKKFLE